MHSKYLKKGYISPSVHQEVSVTTIDCPSALAVHLKSHQTP